MTFGTSRQMSFLDLGSSRAPGLANHFPEQGTEEAIRMTVISGKRCLRLSDHLGLFGSLVRMLLNSSRCDSMKCFLIWKAKTTPSRRLVFRLLPSMHHINGKEFSWLQTPVASKSIACSMQAAQKEAKRLHPRGFKNLATQIATETGSDDPNKFLNVEWIESLMGFPPGWTECEPSEMQSSQESLSK